MANPFDNNHEEYTQHNANWAFYQLSYVGGSEWVTLNNIYRHAREEQEDYDLRLKRAVYLNYCRPVVEIYSNFIFGSDVNITREIEDARFDTFREDVDRRGNSLDDFMLNVANMAQTYGHVGVVVDMPQRGDNVLTLDDARQANLSPYFVLYEPKDILNWAVDRFGMFKWVRLRECVRDDDDPFSESKYGTEQYYRTWTPDAWFVHDKEGALVEEGPNPLGEVPLRVVYYERRPGNVLSGLSQLVDIARINRLMVNLLSYIDEFCAGQAFPIFAQEEEMIPDDNEDLVLSIKRIYRHPPQTNPPTYVSPPTEPAAFMREFAMDTLRKEIYRAAKLESRELQEQSGIAKQFDFHQTNNALVKFARHLEMGEQALLGLWARWQGSEFDGSVDYPDDFNIESLNQTIENALGVRAVYTGMSDTMVSEHLKRLARQVEPNLTAETQAMIDGELDEAVVAASQAQVFEQAVQEAESATV